MASVFSIDDEVTRTTFYHLVRKKPTKKKKEKKPQDRKLILHRDKLSLIISLNLNHECSPEKFQVFLTFQAFYAEFEMFYSLKMC